MTTLFSSPSKQGQQAAQASEGISAQEMADLQNYITTTNTAERSNIGGANNGGFVNYAPGGQSISSTGSAPQAKPVAMAPQAPPAKAGIVPGTS